MMQSQVDYRDWIGSKEVAEEMISVTPALRFHATIDSAEAPPVMGGELPPMWQWFYFQPAAPASQIGPDGHPKRGGFMPPVTLPRRMFAGARIDFARPIVIGKAARRTGEVIGVEEKSGKSGTLVFVTVRYTIDQDGRDCLTEVQDIVYRGAGGAVPKPTPKPFGAAPEGTHVEDVTPTPPLLFRYSAVTFNGHRIHFDRPYAMQEEGYPGLVVHGPLVATLLMELARRNMPGKRAAAFSFRAKAPLFDLHPFRLQARPEGERVVLTALTPDHLTAQEAEARFA